MIETSFSFRNSTNSRFPGKDSKQITGARQGSISSRLINFLKPGCLGKAISKKTRPFNEPEKQMQLLQNKCQITTLGDWMLASPALNHRESDLCSRKPTKNALHPSMEAGEEFVTMKEPIKLDNGCSLCKTQSRNTAERVHFRIPEVVDVFIFDSPEELVGKPPTH